MKSWISKTAITLALLVMLPVLAHADTWQIDPAHTNVEFTVRHMMISNVKGQFQKTAGTITVEWQRRGVGANRRDDRCVVGRHSG